MKSRWLFTMAIVAAMTVSAAVVMAQDATQTPPPVEQQTTTTTDASTTTTSDQSGLPATASPIPLLGLGSLLAVGAGMLLRYRR